MSQYGGQQAFGQQQQNPQYGGQTSGQQNPSSQYGGQQDTSQYGGQQDASQYGGPQDPSMVVSQQEPQMSGQVSSQDPSAQYGGQEQSQSQYGQQQDPSGAMGGMDGVNGTNSQDGQQFQGLGQQDRSGNKQQGAGESKPHGMNGMVNGHEGEGEKKENEHKEQTGMKHDEHKSEEDHNKAVTKGGAAGEIQKHGDSKAGSGRKYHYTHMNALHHMGKAAANGFTPEHIDSLLHLVTYGAGTLANTHGLAPAEPVEPEV